MDSLLLCCMGDHPKLARGHLPGGCKSDTRQHMVCKDPFIVALLAFVAFSLTLGHLCYWTCVFPFGVFLDTSFGRMLFHSETCIALFCTFH